jgi:hypothetical protein
VHEEELDDPLLQEEKTLQDDMASLQEKINEKAAQLAKTVNALMKARPSLLWCTN